MKLAFSFLIILFTIQVVVAQRKHLILDYNPTDTTFDKFFHKEIYDNRALTLTDSIEKGGTKSIRSFVSSSNLPTAKDMLNPKIFVDKSIRAEYAAKSDTYPERWFGISIFAPSNYYPDSEPEIVTQWHDVPDFNLGETWTSPSKSLWVEKGHWSFHVLWDSGKVTKQGHWQGHEEKDLGVVQLNVWTNWVFHIKSSYKSDGLIEVFQNGKKLYHRNGPNSFNDVALPYWKFGIYKWVYKDHDNKHHLYNNRTLFYNQIREGDEKARYSDVAPKAN